MKQAVILARVSTKEQEESGHSLPAQIESLHRYAEKKDFKIVKEFCFSESAGSKIRKKFEEVIAYLRKHKIDVLLCENVDRFTRNFKDAVDLDEMRKNEGLEVHFVKDGFFINKDATGNQMFMWEAKVFLAKQYLNRLSDDVKRSMWQKFDNHEWAGKAPIGYKNIDLENGAKDIVPDEKDGQLVSRLFELYATGNTSYKALTTTMFEYELTNRTGKPLSVSTIEHIIKNPFYYGLMRYGGRTNAHKYTPIISEELFKKCQAIREGWNKKPFQHQAIPFIFRGLVKCEKCGCTITPEKKKDGQYIYYSCTNFRKQCKRVYVPEKTLLEPIYEALKSIQVPEERQQEIAEGLRNMGKSEASFHKFHITNLNREYELLENRISKMYEDKLDGCITQEMYDKKLKEYKEKQAKIITEKRIHSDADEEFYITADRIFSLAKRALDIFKSSEVPEKRQLLKFLFQNLRLDGKNPLYELSSPFNLLAELSTCPNWLRGPDSNRQPTA